jgi:hypothetical protein
MLMLGESILSLLIIDIPGEDTEYFATFYCSLMTVILLQYLHFRSQPHNADDHALRRTVHAGFVWSQMLFVYSVSLIALGAAFTIFVLDFSYDDIGESRRLMMLEGRLLTGGGESKYAQEDLRQMAAHVFSAALSVVFFSLDFMSLLHLGEEHSKERCYCASTKKKNYKGYFLLLVRGGFLCFVATLSQWITDPETLAEIGLASVSFQILIRVLGAIIFPSQQVHAVTTDDHGHRVEEDHEDNKWPNTTHALAEHHVEPDPLFET